MNSGSKLSDGCSGFSNLKPRRSEGTMLKVFSTIVTLFLAATSLHAAVINFASLSFAGTGRSYTSSDTGLYTQDGFTFADPIGFLEIWGNGNSNHPLGGSAT